MSDDLSDGCSTPPVTIRRQQQQRQRDGVMSPRLLMSPKSQNPANFLESNDDEHEKALARAARVSISRRKSFVATSVAGLPDYNGVRPNLFGKLQLVDLFNNCIKLSSENKINQRNTWDLNLIDHMSELVRIDSDDDDAETNFQKASCTLEAGVKIYSLRVDATHSEAYKVLGGINRVSRNDDKDVIEESDKIGNEKEEEEPFKKEQHRKLSPLSTLESSFEALNVKKFDVAFTVDPLYHQTSAQFDEGGAKGLLLCNLGVYGSCKVLFDSFEVPGKNMVFETPSDRSIQIDLSFAREEIEQMVTQMPMKNDISPTLREIVDQFNEDNQRPPDISTASTTTLEKDDFVVDNNDVECEGNESANWAFDPEDQMSMAEYNSFFESNTNNHQEDNDGITSKTCHTDERLITGFLSLGLGFDSKANAWAGPDYWKYSRTKVPEKVAESTLESSKVKKPRNQKQKTSDIEFAKSLEKTKEHIFTLPKTPKMLLLPAKSVPCNVTLPEDRHYQPENLVRLFLLPGALCIGKGLNTSVSEESSSFDPPSGWYTEDAADDQFDDESGFGAVDDIGDLVSQPRQVSKTEVKYDKFSKQVDVHALKEVLWCQIQETSNSQTEGNVAISFRQILESMSDSSQASAGSEISTHLYFICLLHLANEQGLKICNSPTLDELDIYLPRAARTGN